MSSPASILVIEDDPATSSVVKARLAMNGYTVEVADSGTAGYEKARTGQYDCIVLDVMLPGMNGFDVLLKLREEKVDTKILMLTARAELDARVKGLETGADDYLAKPFDHRELLIRVKNLLALSHTVPDTLEVGDVTLKLTERTVVRGGKEELLTDREFELLHYLMKHPGEVVAKESLLKAVWKSDFERDPNVVNVYLSYLRKKLEREGLPLPIETVHGVGVRMIVPPG